MPINMMGMLRGFQLDSRTVNVFLNEQVPSIPGCATETQLTGNSGSLS